MKFRPLHDRVVVRRVTAEEKTRSGIIIPNTAQEKPMELGAQYASGTNVATDREPAPTKIALFA
jgi:chaperonin GroES